MPYYKVLIIGEGGSIIETRELDLPYPTAEMAMQSSKIQSLKTELLKSGHGIQLKKVGDK